MSISISLLLVLWIVCAAIPCTRQHPSYADCLDLKREYYQNSSVRLCDTMFTISSTLIWAVLTGPRDWVCHIGTLTLCVEVVA